MFDRVSRWRIVGSVALALVAIGLWQTEPVFIVGAVIPVGFLVYDALSSAVPLEERLTIERTIRPKETYPGAVVHVELTITNHGASTLPDVRIVDGVPEQIAVVDGSPRAGVGLGVGDMETVSYSVRARYGDFEFESPRVRSTSLSAGSIYTTSLEAEGDAKFSANLEIDEYPLAQQTTGSFGNVSADRGGEGVEFYATRDYQYGDPANRIDWRHFAKRRKLTTVDYRQEEAAEVVVIVDARPTAAVAAAETAPTGVELSVYGAAEAIDGLLGARNRVGLIILGMADSRTDMDFQWIPPGNGPELRSNMRESLDRAVATASAGDSATTLPKTNGGSEGAQETHSTDDDGLEDAHIDRSQPLQPAAVVERISPQTQIVMFTPAIDDEPTDLVEKLGRAGHAISVCSPDVTQGEGIGNSWNRIERGLRFARLQSMGVTVIDWGPDDSLPQVLEQAIPIQQPVRES